MKLINLSQIHRLVTHEDGVYYHMHKVFGALALVNFCYRFFQTVYTGKGIVDMHPYWLFIHAALHITSFNFKLQNKRNQTYNIIWPEMRWHTLIFAYRSILAILIQYLTNINFISDFTNKMLRIPLVFGTIILADYITTIYKPQGTTMRNNPYPEWVPVSFIKYHNLYYSISQVLGTMNILTKRDIGSLFIILLPIQTAPFCMTLVKKGIIDQGGWHVYYTIALVLNYIYNHYYKVTESMCSLKTYWFLSLYFIYGRFHDNSNKYVLWIIVVSMYLFLTTKI